MHFAEELSGRYREDRPALQGVAISDACHLSCVSNDYGYEAVFSRYVKAMGNPGDVLIGFSGAGNSMNVFGAIADFYLNSMKSNFVCGTITHSVAVTKADIGALEKWYPDDHL